MPQTAHACPNSRCVMYSRRKSVWHGDLEARWRDNARFSQASFSKNMIFVLVMKPALRPLQISHEWPSASIQSQTQPKLAGGYWSWLYSHRATSLPAIFSVCGIWRSVWIFIAVMITIHLGHFKFRRFTFSILATFNETENKWHTSIAETTYKPHFDRHHQGDSSKNNSGGYGACWYNALHFTLAGVALWRRHCTQIPVCYNTTSIPHCKVYKTLHSKLMYSFEQASIRNATRQQNVIISAITSMMVKWSEETMDFCSTGIERLLQSLPDAPAPDPLQLACIGRFLTRVLFPLFMIWFLVPSSTLRKLLYKYFSTGVCLS